MGFLIVEFPVKCYKCDGKDCTAAPGEIEECGGEKPGWTRKDVIFVNLKLFL